MSEALRTFESFPSLIHQRSRSSRSFSHCFWLLGASVHPAQDCNKANNNKKANNKPQQQANSNKPK